MPYDITLPDGRVINDIPDNVSQAEAKARILKNFPEFREKGFGAAVKSGLEGLVGAGLGVGLGLNPESEKLRSAVQASQAAQEAKYGGPSYEDVERSFQEQGGVAGLKSLYEFGKGAIGQSLPYMAAPLAGGRLGALAGGALAGPAGAAIGGIGGAGLASAAQFFGTNIGRQVQEGQPIEPGKAALAAIPQAALDVGTLKFAGLGRIFGLEGEKAASKITQDIVTSYKKGIPLHAVKGLAEVPTEVAQQVLERAQAGKDLTGEDAFNEYKASAAAAGLMGPAMGTVGGASEVRGNRRVVQEQQAAQQQAAAAEAAQTRQADEARRQAFAAQQAQIEQAAQAQRMDEQREGSKAYAPLNAAIEAQRQQQAAIEQQKAAGSAFSTEQPDIFGEFRPEQVSQVVTPQEAPQAPTVQPGQMGLPFEEEAGQRSLFPEMMPAAPVGQELGAPAAQTGMMLGPRQFDQFGFTKQAGIRKRLNGVDVMTREGRNKFDKEVDKYGRAGRQADWQALEAFSKSLPPLEQDVLGLEGGYAPTQANEVLARNTEAPGVAVRPRYNEQGQRIIPKGPTVTLQDMQRAAREQQAAAQAKKDQRAIAQERASREFMFGGQEQPTTTQMMRRPDRGQNIRTGYDAGGSESGVGLPVQRREEAPRVAGAPEQGPVAGPVGNVGGNDGGEGVRLGALGPAKTDTQVALEHIAELGEFLTRTQAQAGTMPEMRKQRLDTLRQYAKSDDPQVKQAAEYALRQHEEGGGQLTPEPVAGEATLKEALKPKNKGGRPKMAVESEATAQVRDALAMVDDPNAFPGIRQQAINRLYQHATDNPNSEAGQQAAARLDADDITPAQTKAADAAYRRAQVVKENKARNPDKFGAQLPPEVLAQPTTGQAALGWLEQNAQNKDVRAIAATINRMVDMSNVRTELASPDDTNLPQNIRDRLESALGLYGSFADGTQRVFIRPDGQNEITVLHELVHAATHERLKDPRVLAQFKGLINKVEAAANARYGKGGSKEKVPESVQFFGREALRDPDEFVAYGFSSPTFRAWLDSMGPKQGLWDKFIDAVKRVLGIQPAQAKTFKQVMDSMLEPTLQTEAKPAKGIKAQNEALLERALNFNDWFRGSKITDEYDGALTMYHGTTTDNKGVFQRSEDGALGPGIYFTENPDAASSYAGDREGAHVVPVYLSIKNPLEIKYDPAKPAAQQIAEDPKFADENFFSKGAARRWGREQFDDYAGIGDEEFPRMLRDAGYDGVVLRGPDGKIMEATALSSNQVKSATGNRGTFDAGTGNILSQKESATADLYERTKRLAPPEDANKSFFDKVVDKVGKVGSFFFDPAERDNMIDAFRTKNVFYGAAVESRLQKQYNGAIMDAVGQLRPDVNLLQALHADNLGAATLFKGKLTLDKSIGGWWKAVEDKDSMSSVFQKVHALEQKIGEDEARHAVQVFLLAARSDALNKANADTERQAQTLESRGKKKEAERLRDDKIKHVHLTDDEVDAGLAYAKAYPELRDILDTYTNFKNNLIDSMVESGRFGKEQAEDMKAAIDYVPFHRIQEEEQKPSGQKEYFRGLTDLGKLYKFTGSEKPVDNILDNMVQMSMWMVNNAVRNHAAVRLADALGARDAKGKLITRDAVAPGKGAVSVPIFVDGKRKFIEVGDPLEVEAFKGVEPVALPIVTTLAKFSDVLRKGTTMMPNFLVSQVIQDSMRAATLSGVKNPATVAGKTLSGFVTALGKKDPILQEMEAYGIAGAYDYTPGAAKEKAERELGLKRRNALQKFMDVGEKVAVASDSAQRRAIYDQTLQETGDKSLALYRAMEIINFKRQGSSQVTNIARRLVPFMNAYIQGMDVLARTMAGKGVAAKDRKEAMGLFWRAGMKVAALSTLYAMAMGGDDEYEKQDDRTRGRNFFIPGTDFKLPVPSDVGFFFKIIPELAYRYISTQGTDNPMDARKLRTALSGAAIDALGGPTPIPQAVKTPLEVAINHSFFTGNPIIGRGIEKKETSQQFTENTSEIAKFIGSSGLISPMNVDYMVRGMLGSVGGLLLYGGDSMAAVMLDNPRPSVPAHKTPVISTFLSNPEGRGLLTDYYDLKDQSDKVFTTLKGYVEQRDMGKAKEYMEENKQMLATRSAVSTISGQIEKLRTLRKSVIADPSLSSDQKRAKLDEIDAVQNRMLANVSKLRQTSGL